MMLWLLLLHTMRLLLIIPLSGHADAYTLTECNRAGNFGIVQNQQPVLTCTGLGSSENISWSIRKPASGNEISIGNCRDCTEVCSGCSSPLEGFNVRRDTTGSTTLQFLNHSLIPDRSIIKCYNIINNFNATCTLFVIPAYRIPECRAGAITVVENKTSLIVCEGLLAAQNMYWAIAYGNGTVSAIAECRYCRLNTTTCPPCVIEGNDFMVTRERNSSTLLIQNNVRQTDGATLRCSKRDNATQVDCRIRVVSRDSEIAASTGLPVAVVAGSAAGVVVIVAVVIVIAVFVNRRRSKRRRPKERQHTVPIDDEFEENINEFYQSADDPDLPRHSPRNSPTPLSLANPSVDAQGAGLYGPQKHVYAQVNKEKKEKTDVSKDKPRTTHDVKQHAEGGKTQKHAEKEENQGPSSEEQGAMYTECVSDSKEDNSVTNVYINVDESPPLPTDQDTQATKKASGIMNSKGPDPTIYCNTDTAQSQRN